MYFSIEIPILFFRKTYLCVFVRIASLYLLDSRGDSNKCTIHTIYKKSVQKVSVTDTLDGSYQVPLQQQIRFYSKIFGNKHCRYNEGPLYP